jgi:hypothetical protein
MKNVAEIVVFTEDITVNNNDDIEMGNIAIAEISNTTSIAIPLMSIIITRNNTNGCRIYRMIGIIIPITILLVTFFFLFHIN